MRIVTWNVKGLSDKQKAQRVIRKLRTLKADVIILQEIFINNKHLNPQELSNKVAEISNHISHSWNTDLHFDSHGHLAILSAYKHSLKLTTSYHQGRVLDFTFTHIARGDRKIQIPYFTMNFRAVYAPAKNSEKQPFWRTFPQLPPLCWVIGDFNLGLKKDDHTASTTSDNPGRAKEILENHIDTSHALQNGKPDKTFFRDSLIRPTRSRIDYIFAPEGLLQPYATFRTVDPGQDSDHQILILDNKTKRGTRPEWRMNIDHLNNSFVDRHIKNLLMHPHYSWDGIKIQIKEYLQQHGLTQKQKQNNQILNLTNRLSKLRKNNGSPEDIDQVKTKLIELEQKLAERLAIKSGSQWLEQGERSTKYFFRRFKEKLQFATIDTLKDREGNILHTAEQKAQAIYEHQQQIWGKTNTTDPASFPWFCPSLPLEAQRTLTDPITIEEVKKAISSSPNNKAPGPDGIPSEFYTFHIDIIAPRFVEMFNNILTQQCLPPESWKASKCVLIPKKVSDLDQIANWRPITLENCDLKVFSRILSNRTQQVVSSIIGPEQTGFIAGRRIHHSVLTIEAALNTNSRGSYLLSLDWSKAYDRVSHQWLSYCLQKYGFPKEFIQTIEALFYSRTASISIDREQALIQCGQGVPQGDPFAPLLFVLALEPILKAARQTIEGIYTPQGTLTNTAFADDSTFFIKNNINVAMLELLLENYCDVSGAVVNWEKSKLTPLSNKPPPTNTRFPITAINTPPPTLGFHFPLNDTGSRNTWRELIRKVQWKFNELGSRKSLTHHGRALVCRSLVLSKVWYTATVLSPTPQQIIELERMAYTFILGKSSLHPAKAIAILPKKCGGIGAVDIQLEFQTYAAHLYYQAMMQPNTPWAHYLLSKLTAHLTQQPPELALHFYERSKLKVAPSYSDPTVKQAILGWNQIHTVLGDAIDFGYTHHQIRELIHPPEKTPVMPPTLKWAPHLANPTFKWKQLWIKEMPPKIRDIIWRGAFNALPSRRRLRWFTATEPECSLCNEPEDGPHMIILCRKLRPFWRQIEQLNLYLGVECPKTADIVCGIAYQAVYLSNIYSRLFSSPYSLLVIRLKFRALLNHYRLRLPPNITDNWPKPEEIDRFIGARRPVPPQ